MFDIPSTHLAKQHGTTNGLGLFLRSLAAILMNGLVPLLRPMGSVRAGVDFQGVGRVEGNGIKDGL